MCRIAELSSKAGQLLAATVLALTGATRELLTTQLCVINFTCLSISFTTAVVSTTHQHAFNCAYAIVLFNAVTTAGPVSASDMPAAVEEVAPAAAAPAAKKKIPET